MASNSCNNVFLAYDRDFRKLQAYNSMNWCHLHQEMFFPLVETPLLVLFLPSQRQSSPRKQSFPVGYCFAFFSFFLFRSYGKCRSKVFLQTPVSNMQWTPCHFKVPWWMALDVLSCPPLSCLPSYQHRSTPFGCCSSSVKVGRDSLKVFGFLSGAICNWYQVPGNHPSLLENLSVAMQFIENIP